MDKLHKKIRVFVSYTGHDTDTNTVRAFVDHLRAKGYDAVMDTYLLGKDYSNLYKMMVSGIQTANKVIIILSPEYKKKSRCASSWGWCGGKNNARRLREEQRKIHPRYFLG